MLEMIQSSEAVNGASEVPLEGLTLAASPELSVEFERRNRELSALIEEIVGGDQDALTKFYDLTNRQIYGLVLHIVGDRTVAEEVLFDVYAQVWRQAARYDYKRGKPLPWLIMMARSRALDQLRSQRTKGRRTEPLDEICDLANDVNTEDSAIHSEMRQIVQGALNRLPPEQREVIQLAYYSGLSQSEIASALGQPLGTVKTRTRRAMLSLRNILNPVVEGIL